MKLTPVIELNCGWRGMPYVYLLKDNTRKTLTRYDIWFQRYTNGMEPPRYPVPARYYPCSPLGRPCDVDIDNAYCWGCAAGSCLAQSK